MNITETAEVRSIPNLRKLSISKQRKKKTVGLSALEIAFLNARKASIRITFPRKITENIRKRIGTGRRSSPSHWSSIRRKLRAEDSQGQYSCSA